MGQVGAGDGERAGVESGDDHVPGVHHVPLLVPLDHHAHRRHRAAQRGPGRGGGPRGIILHVRHLLIINPAHLAETRGESAACATGSRLLCLLAPPPLLASWSRPGVLGPASPSWLPGGGELAASLRSVTSFRTLSLLLSRSVQCRS